MVRAGYAVSAEAPCNIAPPASEAAPAKNVRFVSMVRFPLAVLSF
jgi:hypothetical protein